MYNGYNINKGDDLDEREWHIFYSLDYEGSVDKERLFGLCDYNHNEYISVQEFTHCYCYGSIHDGDDGGNKVMDGLDVKVELGGNGPP